MGAKASPLDALKAMAFPFRGPFSMRTSCGKAGEERPGGAAPPTGAGAGAAAGPFPARPIPAAQHRARVGAAPPPSALGVVAVVCSVPRETRGRGRTTAAGRGEPRSAR